MATPRQTAANTLNAARSRGPRTAAGRNRSKRNASKHGLTGTGAGMTLAERPDVHGDPYTAGFVLDLTCATASAAPPTALLARFFRGLTADEVAELAPTPEAARASLLERLDVHIAELQALGDELWERQD